MPAPSVRFRLPDGRIVDAAPGAIVGRTASAGVFVADAAVSEVHGLVTLRGRELKLLALRGLLRTGAGVVDEVPLRAGQRIHLTRDVVLEVLAVALPDHVWRLEGGAAPVLLGSPVWALRYDPPSAVAGYQQDADAHLFDDTEGWSFQVGASVLPLASGDGLPGTPFVLRRVPLADAASPDTLRPGQLRVPIRLVARYETVHVSRPGEDPRVIDGLPARILTELVRFDAPARWDWVARELWGGAVELPTLRMRWDRGLRRTRAALQEAGVGTELLRVDGGGNVELVPGTDDEIIDES